MFLNRVFHQEWFNQFLWFLESFRVRTLLNCSNSMTFHDLFNFSKTLGLVVICLTLSGSIQFSSTQTPVSTEIDVHAICTVKYSSLPYIVLALPFPVNKLTKKTLIFHDFQGPIIKFHDFPGFPWHVQTLSFIKNGRT